MPATSLYTSGGERGYTIVELVLVIVILGVIGVVAAPRFFNDTTFDERAYFDELASAMRYGQKLAVASGCNVRVAISGSGYVLTQQAALSGHCNPADSSYPVPVLLSSGDAVTGSAPAGVTTTPAVTFVYTALGQTTLGANQDLTIGSRVLSIQADSGLVYSP